MKSDLLCFIPEQLCSGVAEHIFEGIGCCAIILFEGVGVDVHGRGSLCMTQADARRSARSLRYDAVRGTECAEADRLAPCLHCSDL